MKKLAVFMIIFMCFSSGSILAQSGDNPFTEEQERCISKSVVQLQVQTADGTARRASGVVVHSEGIIFTNAHVVEDATEIQVWTYEQAALPPVFAYFATLQLLSEDLDFAVIEIVADAQGNPIDKENLDFSCTLPWNKTPLTRYAPIYIVGYPDIGGGVLTSTSGIVSAPLQQTGINGQNISLYTTDAIFSDGGSGGLVVNTRGEFLGIPSYWRTQSDGTGQLTYFIPLSTVCEIEPAACEYEPRNPINIPTPVSTDGFNRNQFDSIFGTGNWFCLPDQWSSIGVRALPASYVVELPIIKADYDGGSSSIGQVTPCCVGSTMWLNNRFPQSECPLSQLNALSTWQSDSIQHPISSIDRSILDTLFVPGTWRCLQDFDYAAVGILSEDTTIGYPIIGINSDPVFYGVGDTVSSGRSVTVWFSSTTSIPRSGCNF